jgi:putative addiction module component (TIGR02574 family)
MQTAELVALPLKDRLIAMEALWESLCVDPAQLPSVPNWHQDELMLRVAALDAGEVGVSPWEDAKVRIRDRARAMTPPT